MLMLILIMMVEIGNPVIAILAGLATLATALGAPKWFPSLFKSKNKEDHQCRKDIERIIAAFSILLTVIEDKLDEPGMKSGVEEAREIIREMKHQYS